MFQSFSTGKLARASLPTQKLTYTRLDNHPEDQFVLLPFKSKDGEVMVKTRYRIYEPKIKPVYHVIYQNGLSTELSHSHLLCDLLAQHGCRVLTFDKYGHGLTEAPETALNHATLTAHMRQVVTHPDIASRMKPPFVVGGESRGGGVSLNYAADYPDDVSHLILVCPDGMNLPIAQPLWYCAQIPWFNIYMSKVLAPKQVKTMLAQSKPKWDQSYIKELDVLGDSMVDWITQEVGQRSFLSVLASYVTSLHAKATELAKHKKSVIIFVGTKDDICYTGSKALQQILSAELVSYEGASHLIEFEKKSDIYAKIIEFLKLKPVVPAAATSSTT